VLLLAELLLLLLAGLLLLLAELFLLLAGLLLLLLEWQLLLGWLMLVQLLAALQSLLLAELLLPLLRLELLSVWRVLLLLLSLLDFLTPRPPSCAFAVLATESWQGACCPAHALAEYSYRRSQCACCLRQFQNQSGSGACSNALLVLHHDEHGRPTKVRKLRRGSGAHVVCLSLLNH
jgi:hypothetical protein